MKGRRFGRLLVLEHRGARCACLCHCAARPIVATKNLLNGKTRSCGCLRRELTRTRSTRHAASTTQVYKVWSAMLQRCENPKNKRYADYGGRGIQVAERWHRFEHFIADMGPRPPGAMIDRERNERGYEPGNCSWVTRAASNKNKRTVALIEYQGTRYTLPELATRLGVSVRAMQRRFKRGDRVKMFRRGPMR